LSKVLIIADGKYGNILFNKILNDTVSSNTYHILTHSVSMRQIYKDNIHLKNIIFFHVSIDIHSLKQIMKKHHYQHIVVCLKNKTSVVNVLDNIKQVDIKSKISFLNHWNIPVDDDSITSIDTRDVLSNRLMNTVPNILATAQNVGSGEGELVEIDVPRESEYIYRHISSIKQKNFSIAAIYRGKEVVLPTSFSMILPNDTLLGVGQPRALQNFYNLVHGIGSFSKKIRDVLVVIDMQKNSKQEIFCIIKKAIRFYNKLELEHIFIKVINPKDIATLESIKKLYKRYITVDIVYSSTSNLLASIKKQNPGFIVISHSVFEKYKKIFYSSKIPVLCTSSPFLADDNFLLLSSKNYILYESISSGVFYFSSKMNVGIWVVNTEKKEGVLNKKTSEYSKQDKVIEHYQTLSGIFKKQIKITKQQTNAILSFKELKSNNSDLLMQTLPFGKDIVYSNKFSAPFMKNNDKLYYKLSSYDQLFLPI